MAAVAAPGTIVASARCKAQTPSRGVRSTRVVRGARNVRGINSGRAENRTAIVSRCTGENTVEKGALQVTSSTWEDEVLKSPVPVLVDFWAPWCGPCRMIEPFIDQLAEEYEGKIRAVKLNTDESPNIATEYGIRSIPTVMIFKDGEKVETVIGAVPKTTLVNTIDKFL